MTGPRLNVRRLFAATIAILAVIGWGALAYASHAFATRDEQRQEALIRVTTERDQLMAERQRLVAEQQRLVGAQQRFNGELTFAKAQLATAQEELALLRPEKKADLGRRKPEKAPGATASSELTKFIASKR
jgi:uncharacterized protein HemX